MYDLGKLDPQMNTRMQFTWNFLGWRHNAGGRGGLQLIGLKWRGGSYFWLSQNTLVVTEYEYEYEYTNASPMEFFGLEA